MLREIIDENRTPELPGLPTFTGGAGRIFLLRLHQKTSIPMVFMTYANVVYSYGTERFAEGGSRNRDGVIVGSAIVKLCEKYGADCVPHISTFVKEMKDAIR